MNGFDAPGSTESSDDLWHVQLPSGAVRVMTLDELDTFFNEGIIDERAQVRRDGSSAWHTLAEVAGLDETPPAPVYPTFTPPPVSVMPNSIRPVAFDVDDLDLDLVPARSTSSKRRFVVYGALLGAAVAAVFVGANRYGLSTGAPAVVQASLAPVVVPVAVKQAPPAPVVTPAPAPAADTAAGSRLSEAQKQALLAVDKERAAQQAVRAKERKMIHRAKPSRPVFHKGGSRYDPLNAKL